MGACESTLELLLWVVLSVLVLTLDVAAPFQGKVYIMTFKDTSYV